MIKRVTDLKPGWIFLVLCVLEFFGNYGVSGFLWSDDIYLSNFSGSDFEEYISLVRKIDLVRYLLMPFYLFAKVVFIGTLFFGILYLLRVEVPFREIFIIASVSEVSFVLSDFAKIIWFTSFNPNYTASELKDFHPFSLMQLFGRSEGWSDLIFETLNIWHLIYVLLWAVGLWNIGIERRDALKYSIATYGILLILWLVIRSFVGFESGQVF